MDDASDQVADFAARRDRQRRRFYARAPKRIRDVVAQLITERGYGRIQTNQALANAWQTAAGPALSAASRPGRIHRGKLDVLVTTSTVMQEFSFEKRRILAELQRQLPDAGIRELRLRVGTFQ